MSKPKVGSPTLCFLYAFLKQLTFLAFFISLGILFQPSTTLLEKKWHLTSNLVVFGLRFRGSSALLVARPVSEASWNCNILLEGNCGLPMYGSRYGTGSYSMHIIVLMYYCFVNFFLLKLSYLLITRQSVTTAMLL